MKAIILNDFGPIENLQVTDLPVPAIGKEDVLIKVASIGINPVDIKTREGKGASGSIKERPIIIGWDVSGEVVESNSSHFKKGDLVFGMVNFPGHGKAYAEYVAAPAAHIVLKPDGINHDDAAAACLAALTAWQNITEHYRLKKGDRILVHAASGGVGHYAVQMAKQLGAYVIATSSAENKRFVMGLGADEHIDYQAVNFEDELSDIDFVLNTHNAETGLRSLKVLKKGGTLISIASAITDEIKEEAAKKDIRAVQTMVKSSGKDMQQIADMLDKGEIRSEVSQIFSLDDMRKAHAAIASGHTVGKIVVKP